MNVLVCDDRDDADIVAAINDATGARNLSVEAVTLVGTTLGEKIVEFFDQVRELLDGKGEIREIKSAFDSAEIVLLDYGLTTLPGFKVRLTADMVAGYIRAFSDAAYVVALNKNPNIDFDLKYLLGDFDTRADLALRTDHLGEPGLWDGQNDSDTDFCPWYWPKLCRAPGRRTQQIDVVEQNLDASILHTLRFPPEVLPHLSRQAIAFLSPLADDEHERAPEAEAMSVANITFWNHFQRSNRTLPRNDREALLRRYGANLEDSAPPKDPALRKIAARVVAGELDFWFRRDILGPQKLLIDPPHLQAWLRFRDGEDADDLSAWNRTAVELQEPYGLDSRIVAALPEQAKFVDQPWTDCPAFWLPLIEEDEEFDKILENANRTSNYVFCEDIRRFLPRSECTRFVSELTKGIDVRYVKKLDKQYSPASQFAF